MREDIEQRFGSDFPHINAICFRSSSAYPPMHSIKAEAGHEYIHLTLIRENKINLGRVERNMK